MNPLPMGVVKSRWGLSRTRASELDGEALTSASP